MDAREAAELAHRITEESSLQPNIDLIGNGESVVVLKNKLDRFFLWSPRDWAEHKHLWGRYIYTLA